MRLLRVKLMSVEDQWHRLCIHTLHASLANRQGPIIIVLVLILAVLLHFGIRFETWGHGSSGLSHLVRCCLLGSDRRRVL